LVNNRLEKMYVHLTYLHHKNVKALHSQATCSFSTNMHHRWIKTLRGHIHYVSLCTQL